MKKVIILTESDLIKIVKKVIKEQDYIDDFFSDDLSNEDPEEEDDDILDYGFDYSSEDDFEDKMKQKNITKKVRSISHEFPVKQSSRWSKSDDSYKPYSPIKSDDMDLDTYLKSIRKK